MELTECKSRLYDALLSHRGLQHMVDVAADLLGNPFIVADRGMHAVCRSSSCGQFEGAFSWLGDDAQEKRYATSAADSGYFERIYGTDDAVMGTVGDSPRYLAARIRDGSEVFGQVLVEELGRPFEEGDFALLPIVCQTLAFEMRRMRDASPSHVGHGQLLSELLDGTAPNPTAAVEHIELLWHKLPRPFRVIVLRQVDPHTMVPLSYVGQQLDSCLTCSLGVVREQEVAQVVDGSQDVGTMAERLARKVYLGGNAVGVSRAFGDPALLHEAYVQADAAVRLGNAKAGEVRRYNEVAGRHLLDCACRGAGVDRRTFLMPELVALAAMDERDQTERIADAAAFARSGGNVSRAARHLGIHKNTLYYRLERIRDLVGLDLEDDDQRSRALVSLALMGRMGLGQAGQNRLA